MKEAIVKFFREIKLQLIIRFKDGRRELALYRLERDYDMPIIWAPSKGRWVRARVFHWGFKYVRVRFVDGAEKAGKRSPLSIRPRDPRCRGNDKPYADARFSGRCHDLYRLVWDPHPPSMDVFYETSLGLPYNHEGG